MTVDQQSLQLSQLKEENQRLHKAVDELSILNDLARVVSSTMAVDTVIENVVKRSVRAVHGQQGTITLVDEQAPTEMRTLIRAQDSTSDHQQFHLNQNVLGWMLINKKPLLSNDISSDPRFSGVRGEADQRSILCVPLLAKNRLIGILAVFNKKENGAFTEDDKRLLSIIAAQSGQVLENARLYEQEFDKMAMERDLFAAREVQMSLLPRKLPVLPNFEFSARTIPAREVGGDYYDFIMLDGNRCEVVIADVAGKGLTAALLAAMGKGVIFAESMQHESPRQQLQGSNHILRQNFPRKSFVTMLLSVIDAEKRTVTISNAGHCYPFLYRHRTSSCELIVVKGMALNFADEIQCDEQSISLDVGDCLVLYTDGVNEAQDKKGEFFGIEKLQSLIVQHAQGAPEALIHNIVEDIKHFSKDTQQSDDITLLVVKGVA